MSIRPTAFTFVASFLLSFVPGCKLDPPAADLPSFQDAESAPGPIKNAAQAVVRIETVGELATGSFITNDGVLLTNNHVLGVAICPLEGCYASVSFYYQRGTAYAAPTQVFVVPIAVDTGLDMAVVQAYSSQGGAKLSTPNYLALDARSPSQLIGTHVSVVGHPEGDLKKWSSGTVVDSDGTWIWANAYSLPGNSGSPILSDDGKMVGILHRGPTSQDLFTATGADEYMIGTASAPLIAAMQKAALPAAMVSVASTTITTAASVVANDHVYLNARVSSATLAASMGAGNEPSDVLSLLGTACDNAIASTTFASPDDLTTLLTPCADAMDWIECRTDASSFGAGPVCPQTSDLTTWGTRFQSAFEKWRAYNGELPLDYVSFGQAALQSSMQVGTSVGAQELQDALIEAAAPLDFQRALYLAAFQVSAYDNVSIPDYVTGFTKVPGYALSGGDIASAAVWLANSGAMTRDASLAILTQLANDGTIDIGTKLWVEVLQWEAGVIQ